MTRISIDLFRANGARSSHRNGIDPETESYIVSTARPDKKKACPNDHGIRDITLRHDLHALSKFFGYAIKQRWARDNPVRNVTIPSDAEAIRIHVLTFEEERKYFLHAAKHGDLNDLGRLILNQGMRPDEVTCLRKTDVDLVGGSCT